jgi:hypothetical protein
MPDAIESKSFRAAARKNCISYLGIPIYVTSIPDLVQMSLPSFQAQSPDGAVSQLFATLVNMSTQIAQIRKNLRMTDSKPVPGVSYGEVGGMGMSINGDVYFEDARQYNEFATRIESIGREYGWVKVDSSKLNTSVYHPAQNSFTNIDPIQAAIKGMVLGTVSDMMDAGTLLGADDNISKGSDAEKAYFEARDRYRGGSIFNSAAIQYYSNTPTNAQNAWAGMGNEMIPTLLIEGKVRGKANIPYMPTSLNVSPGAFVVDASGYYPTRCSISMQMHNPLGGLFANFSKGSEGAADKDSSGAVATIPSNYLKGYAPY